MKMLKRIFMVTAFSFFTVNALVANDRLLREYVNNPVAMQFCSDKRIDLASFLYLNGTDILSEADFTSAKKQFKTLAIACHPDKNPNNETAEQVFKLVGAQYDDLVEQRNEILEREAAEQIRREQEIRYKAEQERIYRAEQIVREQKALLAKIAKQKAAQEREAAILRAAANRVNAEVRTERPTPQPSLFRKARNYTENYINDTIEQVQKSLENPFAAE